MFIFNHQSGLDAVLMARLLRRDVVGVAKVELRDNPILGSILSAAGTGFVERGSDSAATMKPAVKALREGLSLIIAPEGIRSSTPRLRRFKKGAFHTSMQAGVPIVPVVFRNALDALPNKAIVIGHATVQIVVHPPISTDDWPVEDLDERIDEIHRILEETLERWFNGRPPALLGTHWQFDNSGSLMRLPRVSRPAP